MRAQLTEELHACVCSQACAHARPCTPRIYLVLQLFVVVHLLHSGDGAPLCKQPGLLRTVVGGRKLCLETSRSGRLVLNGCNPTATNQWWQGRSVGPSEQLLLSESLSKASRSSFVHKLGATAGTCAEGLKTSACLPTTTGSRFAFSVDDAQRMLFRGRCLAISEPGGAESNRVDAAIPLVLMPCAEGTTLAWEQLGCRPLPSLFDAEHNWARGAPAVLSSHFGESIVAATQATALTDGYPDEHGWSNDGCAGIHTADRDDELLPWVTIDLQRRIAVDTVQIWTRPPCHEYSAYLCQNRLWKFSIYVGDEPPPPGMPEMGVYSANGPPCAVVDGDDDAFSLPRGMYVNVECSAKAGRYVTVQQMQSLDAAFPGIMNLCQIRVFGGDLTPSPPPAAPSYPPPLQTSQVPRLRQRLSTFLGALTSPKTANAMLKVSGWCTSSSHRHTCAVINAAIEAFIITAMLAVCMFVCEWCWTAIRCSVSSSFLLPVAASQQIHGAGTPSLIVRLLKRGTGVLRSAHTLLKRFARGLLKSASVSRASTKFGRFLTRSDAPPHEQHSDEERDCGKEH